jgi:acyl-CoA synthetase (AMP-forming)/AMP-acid ligase II
VSHPSTRRAVASPWFAALLRRLTAPGLLLRWDDGPPDHSRRAVSRAEAWSAAFRDASLVPGDRILLALPPGPDFLAVLLGAWASSLTVAVASPGEDASTLAAAVAVRLAITGDSADPSHLPAVRPPAGPPTPELCLLLRTSGTTGSARWVGLSAANVGSVLKAHRPALDLHGGRALSVLPWHHAFGLVLDLLPALLDARELVRDPAAGREPASLPALIRRREVTHLSAVPRTWQRLAASPGGADAVARLRGGLVGGAPVTAAVAEALAGSWLRVGYGLTEASPGVCLGEPGEFRPFDLGRPAGCEVRVGPAGTLEFRGANACAGFWTDSGWQPAPPRRWVDTGDLAVAEAGGSFTFLGRADDRFKLANGRFVEAGRLETAIRNHFPQVTDCLLDSPDGERLRLRITADGPLPTAESLRPLFVGLADRLDLVPWPADGWVRTRKGTLDRRAMGG